MTFGERIVFYRGKKNINQKQLAQILGITPTRLNYWEKDKRQPDVAMIKAISEALDVSPDILIGNALDEFEQTKNSPEPEGSEDEKNIQMIVNGLTDLLVKAGWVSDGGDLTDAQLRTLASYVIGLNAYFNGQS